MKKILATSIALMLALNCLPFMGRAYGFDITEKASEYAGKIRATGEWFVGKLNLGTKLNTIKAIPKSLYSASAKSSSVIVRNQLKKLDTGNGFTIRIKDGIPWVSGDNQKGVNVTTSEKIEGISGVKSVAAVDKHALLLLDNNTVFGWGDFSDGKLGNGMSSGKTAIPVQMKNIDGAIAVAAGVGHSTVLKKDGTVWVTGLGTSGQVGNGLFENVTGPVQVKGLPEVKAVQAGRWHNVAVDARGQVWTWGINGAGQCGLGNTSNIAVPAQVNGLSGIVTIACGSCHTLAVNDKGEVFAWGFNKYGQVGDGTTKNSETPKQVKGLKGIKISAVAVGRWHSLALDNKGNVYTWGYNGYGQLGAGTTTDRSQPKKIEGLPKIVSISAGECQSFATDENGQVWGWGKNEKGELGINKTVNMLKPTLIK